MEELWKLEGVALDAESRRRGVKDAEGARGKIERGDSGAVGRPRTKQVSFRREHKGKDVNTKPGTWRKQRLACRAVLEDFPVQASGTDRYRFRVKFTGECSPF